jgi:hypothetical protein
MPVDPVPLEWEQPGGEGDDGEPARIWRWWTEFARRVDMSVPSEARGATRLAPSATP